VLFGKWEIENGKWKMGNRKKQKNNIFLSKIDFYNPLFLNYIFRRF
jgi:hypothetical protein